MAIEFRCTGCQQQLRVPDESAGKSAKCPKCSAIVLVPNAPAPAAGSGFPPVAPPPQQPQFQPASPFAAKPFGAHPAAGASPFGGGGAASAPPNPYASPQAATYQPSMPLPGGPIVNQVVSVEQVFNYAWQIWQVNLGLLVGTTVTIVAISWVIGFVMGMIQVALLQNDAPPEAINILNFVSNIVSNLLQMYLGIGQAQIYLQLARRQPANFSELFGAAPLFLPVFAASLLAAVVLIPAYLLLIIPGVILSLMFWPFYYLIVDRKAGIIESFSMAAIVTKNNWGTAFVLALLGFGINLLGCMALCIGIVFSAPLVGMMFAVAYLMMSGQLSPYGQLPGQPMPGQYAPQPMPGKW